MRGPTRERLACLIVARNLGDVVIQSGFMRELAARGYAEEYLVWTRPQVAFLFQDIPRCELVCSQFPLGTTKQFGAAAALQLLQAARAIRRRRPSVTLDLIGDVRERWLARLSGSRRHLHIGWAADHPFSRLIRNPWGSGRPLVTVPASHVSVYAGYQLMLQALAPGTAEPKVAARRPVRHVGLHPFASQACKLWPSSNWRELAGELIRRGVKVSVFGAPAEHTAVLTLLGDMASSREVTVVCETLKNFVRYTAELDVMVGLDSFAVHVAGLHGIRSVTINGGNPPGLWAVTGTGVTLGSSGGCPRYPCFNVPRCSGSDREYVCVKSITVGQVLEAIGT
jgi:heptosyltransferase-3